ncbi:MAG: hypothetical protein GY869_32540, partial [Planctomycetes bacterium]|nr:hypothetical protein [Planctomycetota bacterium]
PYIDTLPAALVVSIRQGMIERVPGIKEKFNKNIRYFGYWTGTDKDRAYIYVQKKALVIDVCIHPDYITQIRSAGFVVKPRENFQGVNGWLTGWKIPHASQNVDEIVNWLCKTFEKTY